jgi:hypothetical protein
MMGNKVYGLFEPMYQKKIGKRKGHRLYLLQNPRISDGFVLICITDLGFIQVANPKFVSNEKEILEQGFERIHPEKVEMIAKYLQGYLTKEEGMALLLDTFPRRSNLTQFREELFEIAKDISSSKRHLFEPFVSFGDPFESTIFFIGANGVLDDETRPMLPFLNYWSDENGFEFSRWHHDLANLPKGLSKTRRNADKMIAMFNRVGFQNKVLSTNVFSVGSARLANLEQDHRSVAPFQYLIENLNPEALFVFGSDARNAFFQLWPDNIQLQKATNDGIQPFQLNLNGKAIRGIFTKHLCYQTGDMDLSDYVSALLRLLKGPADQDSNQNDLIKPISKMEKQSVLEHILPYNEVMVEVKKIWMASPNNEIVIANQNSSDPLKIIKITEDNAIYLNRKASQCNPLSRNAMRDLYENGQWKNFNLKTGPFVGTMKCLCHTVEYLKTLRKKAR